MGRIPRTALSGKSREEANEAGPKMYKQGQPCACRALPVMLIVGACDVCLKSRSEAFYKIAFLKADILAVLGGQRMGGTVMSTTRKGCRRSHKF